MSDVSIRLATMDDYDAICRLLAQVDRHHVESLPAIFQPFEGPTRPRDVVARYVEGPDADYILAEAQDEVVGLLNLRVEAWPEYPVFRPGKFAMIENMAVDERLRGRGIGAALLREAQRWTRRHGLASVQLYVWAANEPAVAFYRKHGFQRIVERMELRLDGD